MTAGAERWIAWAWDHSCNLQACCSSCIHINNLMQSNIKYIVLPIFFGLSYICISSYLCQLTWWCFCPVWLMTPLWLNNHKVFLLLPSLSTYPVPLSNSATHFAPLVAPQTCSEVNSSALISRSIRSLTDFQWSVFLIIDFYIRWCTRVASLKPPSRLFLLFLSLHHWAET